MAIVAHTIGSSAVTQPKEVVFSLIQRMITKTPTDFNIDSYFPFTDVALAPSGTAGNTLATFKVPTMIHSAPNASNLSRVSPPTTRKKFLKGGKNDPDGNDASLLSSGLIERLWPVTANEEATGDMWSNIEFFDSEVEALEYVDDNKGEFETFSRIAVVTTDKYTKVLYHDMFIHLIAREIRRAVEDMGAWRPAIAHIGLGHINESGSQGKLVSPSLRWTAGSVAWKNRSFPARGSVYTPSDYLPYSTLKRIAPYYNVFYQTFFEWFYNLGDSQIGLSKASKDIDGMESIVWAMAQMVLSAFTGTTDNPSPPNSVIDEENVVQNFKPLFLTQFCSGYYHFDPVTQHETGANRGDLKQLRTFWGHQILMSAVLAAVSDKIQGCTFPSHLLFEGGPKPEQVVAKMAMNIRPDYVFGSSSSSELPFTLLPSSLSNGESLFRVPCLFKMKGKDKDVEMEWYGPKDPVVIQGVLTENYNGEVPETVIEEDFYYSTPVIKRDAMMMQTYYNYRHYNVAWLPRPNIRIRGITDLGHVFSLLADTKPINGAYLSQPLSIGIVKNGDAAKVDVRTANTGRSSKGNIVEIFDKQLAGQKAKGQPGQIVDHQEDSFTQKVTKRAGINEDAEGV